MRNILIVAALVAAPLAGCETVSEVGSAVSSANAMLAHLSQYDIPAACGIINVAEGYFEALAPKISAANKTRYQTAKTVVANICANPPSNVLSAINTLAAQWVIIQAATKTN
jgi:predicted small secreted protein